MSEPKVSIIVPVYNASDYICRCMDSLINQSLEDIEIIAINDGSTDDSLEILKEYEKTDSRVTVLTQEDLGQGNAVNRGFDLARGKYVAECDAIYMMNGWEKSKGACVEHAFAKTNHLMIYYEENDG